MRRCPKCKANEFTNRGIVLMINECGHSLCQNCVENMFVRNVNKCPHEDCGKMLKKSNFWIQQFDDPTIEREIYIRKRISKTYNLQQDDFSTLREFNNYLEHVEEMVFRLVSEIDVDQTEAEIKQYKEQNSEIIERNRRRPTVDDIWISKMLEDETNRSKRLRENDGLEAKQKNIIDSKSIINELRDSDLPAEIVLDRKRKLQIEAEMAEKDLAERKKRDKQERLRQMKDRAAFGPLRVSGEAYMHVPPVFELNGPRRLSTEEITQNGYLQRICLSTPTATIGGLTPLIIAERMLMDARMELFVM